MSVTTVLFDLDGTLLPMDQDEFIKDYFRRIRKAGFSADRLFNEPQRGGYFPSWRFTPFRWMLFRYYCTLTQRVCEEFFSEQTPESIMLRAHIAVPQIIC